MTQGVGRPEVEFIHRSCILATSPNAKPVDSNPPGRTTHGTWESMGGCKLYLIRASSATLKKEN